MNIHQPVLCWNGPCEGQTMTDAPIDAGIGSACAVLWQTVSGKDRYAVYILLQKPSGENGLVFDKSFQKITSAQTRMAYIKRQVMKGRAMAANASQN